MWLFTISVWIFLRLRHEFFCLGLLRFQLGDSGVFETSVWGSSRFQFWVVHAVSLGTTVESVGFDCVKILSFGLCY